MGWSLPSRLGGLGISNPEDAADEQYNASLRITAPLAALIVQQETSISTACEEVQKVRNKIRKESRQRQENRAQTLKDGPMQRHLELASGKGATTWLEALPIKDQGFHLSRNEFRDSLYLRYGWRPSKLPATCICGQDFSTTHALSCPTGGLPSVRHNEIRDLLAATMAEVWVDVKTEP